MRFLLDVHIPTTIARALAEKGYDVVRALDAHADWSDARLLDLAVDDDRMLVTQDRDFSDLVFNKGKAPPPAILYLRFEPQDLPGAADRLLFVLANTSVKDHMAVIRSSSLRLRPLPPPGSNHG